MGGIGFEQPGYLVGAGLALAAGGFVALTVGRRAGGRVAAGWVLRGLVIALVLAAIARPTWMRPAGPARLVVLVDRSASMPPGWSEQLLRQLPERLGEVELIAFSFAGQAQRVDLTQRAGPSADERAGPSSDQRAGPSPGPAVFSPADPSDGSDPGPAARLAAAALESGSPPGGGRSVPMLLLTDGNWTAPADWAADWPGAIWALCPPVGRANAGLTDLAIAEIEPGGESTPAQPRPRRLAVRATLAATRDGIASVRLSAPDLQAGGDWQPLPGTQRRVQLDAGQVRAIDWDVRTTAEQVRADLSAGWDELPGDNRLAALAPPPVGRRTCLLIAAQPAGPTRQALAGLAGWQLLRRSPAEAARDDLLSAVQPPEVVVLDDLPADALERDWQIRLGDYLADGGGLLVVGGPHALAAGRYHDAPLDALLPVRSLPRARPATAVVLILDRSGSMNEPPSLPPGATTAAGETAATKLDLVKQAVLGLGDLFEPGDRLAVIGFADQAKTIYQSPPGEPVDWQAVRRALLNLSAGGGTAIEPAVRAAADWLVDQDAPRKHVLLLTDGQFTDLDVDGAANLLARATEPHVAQPPSAVRPTTQPSPARLTVSTFAASEQTERRFLAELADRFGGTYFPPGDWGRLRSRFRDDLAGAMSRPILPGPAAVEPFGGRPALPAIGQMLTSELREGGGLWYAGRSADEGGKAWPLVAVRPVGAGRSAVIATSLADGWAASWVSDVAQPPPAVMQSPAGKLLARLLGDLAGPGDDPRFVLQIVPGGAGAAGAGSAGAAGERSLGLDLWVRERALRAGPSSGPESNSVEDRPLNLLDLAARLTAASGEQETVPLPQVGPGRYFATVRAAGPRRLIIVQRLGGGAGERVVLRRTLGPALPVEFAHLAPQPAALDALCRAHGGGPQSRLPASGGPGRLLDRLDQLAEIKLAPTPQPRPLAPWLLLAALTAWVAEVLVSRAGGRTA